MTLFLRTISSFVTGLDELFDELTLAHESACSSRRSSIKNPEKDDFLLATFNSTHAPAKQKKKANFPAEGGPASRLPHVIQRPPGLPGLPGLPFPIRPPPPSNCLRI